MENNNKDCFCKSYSKIPMFPYPSSIMLETIFRKHFKTIKDGKITCRKCGRIITDEEIKERAKKIIPIVW